MFLVCLLAPLLVLWEMARARATSGLQSTLRLGAGVAALAFLGLCGRWDWFGVWLPAAFASVAIALITAGTIRARTLPFRPAAGAKPWLALIAPAAALVVLAWLTLTLTVARLSPEATVDLAFPLGEPNWFVAHGGTHRLINPHRSVSAQSHALDIVALNDIGTRADGLLPTRLEDYATFGAAVLSPCEGAVLRAEDGLPDLAPLKRDPARPAGNHVVIGCRGVSVVLAHLRQESVAVEPGEHVARAQPIAAVGNSGNTTEPHLHVHAIRGRSVDPDALLFSGEPVALTFEGRFLARGAWRWRPAFLGARS